LKIKNVILREDRHRAYNMSIFMNKGDVMKKLLALLVLTGAVVGSVVAQNCVDCPPVLVEHTRTEDEKPTNCYHTVTKTQVIEVPDPVKAVKHTHTSYICENRPNVVEPVVESVLPCAHKRPVASCNRCSRR